VADRDSIRALLHHLKQVSTDKLVLISTVDVYPIPSGVDEDSPIDASLASPYGRHRYELEQELSDHFDTTIIRLPGLFGVGLKKNIIFDMLNNNQVDRIDPRSVFQYYNLERLSQDIQIVLNSRLSVVNFATEPIVTSELLAEVFGRVLPARPGLPVRYDFRTRYADRFGGSDGYMVSRDQIMQELKQFVNSYSPRLVSA
jgi:nucleoside-diphosphate-sugar epimerase